MCSLMARDLFIETGVPAWLQPPKKDRGEPYPEYTVERALGLISGGQSVASICADDPGMPEVHQLLKHFHSTPQLEGRYHEAQRVGAEAMLEDALQVALGNSRFDTGVPMEVARSTLVVNTLKWMIKCRNKRYQDTAQVEVKTTLDITGAMAKALERSEALRAKRQGITIEGELDDE